MKRAEATLMVQGLVNWMEEMDGRKGDGVVDELKISPWERTDARASSASIRFDVESSRRSSGDKIPGAYRTQGSYMVRWKAACYE